MASPLCTPATDSMKDVTLFCYWSLYLLITEQNSVSALHPGEFLMERISFDRFTQSLTPEDTASGSIFGTLFIEATRFLLEKYKTNKRGMVGNFLSKFQSLNLKIWRGGRIAN